MSSLQHIVELDMICVRTAFAAAGAAGARACLDEAGVDMLS
jgi:hypothetical protein